MVTIGLPDIDTKRLDGNEYAKKINDYLFMLNEQIKYAMFSMNDEIDTAKDEINRVMKNSKGVMSQFRQQADSIVLKVDDNGRIVAVELGQDPEKGSLLTISADNINMSGYVTIADLAGEGTTEINGKNIMTGSIMSKNYLLRDGYGNLVYDSLSRPQASGIGTMINLETGYSVFSGKYRYAWLDEPVEEHAASISMENGRIRIRDKNEGGSLYYSYEGVSTTEDGNEASGIIDFKSTLFGESRFGNLYRGITVKTRNSPIGFISEGNHVIICPNRNQALYDPEDKSVFDKFVFGTRKRFDTDTAGNINYGSETGNGGGIIYYGKRQYNKETDRYEYAVGLEMSAVPGEKTVYITDGAGKRGEGYLEAKNLPKPVRAMSIAEEEISITTKDGTGTYALTKDKSGRITKMEDENGNVIKITWG